jgi:hypothetical protein
MGTWAPDVQHFDSNWRELRTLLWTIERLANIDFGELARGTLFYFTDNLVTYYVVQNGNSASKELHKLVRAIKLLEVALRCRVEVVHVPGRLMSEAGPDGLSRGVWLSPDHLLRSTVEESRISLGAVPLSLPLEQWLLRLAGVPEQMTYTRHHSNSSWEWVDIIGQLLIWYPIPEIANQAICHFLDFWVERAGTTQAIFIIPRILQREWGYLAKHVLEIGVFYPHDLPTEYGVNSLIPFCVLFIAPYVRCLPPLDRVEPFTATPRHALWHQAQADEVRRLRMPL